MNVQVRQVNSCTILDCSGKLTLGAGTMALRKAVKNQCIQGCKRIIINLADVSYLDQSGVGELLSSHIKLKEIGGRIVLLKAPEKIQRHFNGFKESLPECLDSEQEALAKFL